MKLAVYLFIFVTSTAMAYRIGALDSKDKDLKNLIIHTEMLTDIVGSQIEYKKSIIK